MQNAADNYQKTFTQWQFIQLAIKGLLDWLFSLVLLLLLLPLFVLIAVWIKLDSPGPVFFRQVRLGRHASEFLIWKFRTMKVNADEMLDDEGNALGNRITRTGQWLRLTSLDELPQLINILLGDMSIIGPRPVIPEHLPRYNEHQKGRFMIKPGVTGLAQVNGRNTLKWSERLNLDVTYINNFSLLNDAKILLKTFVVVLHQRDIVLDRNLDDVDDLKKP